MENNNNKSGGNFLGGFLLGFLAGAALVFFLGEKRVKRFLKTISEEGMDKASDLLDKVDEKTGLDEIYEEEEEVAPREKIAKQEFKEKPKIKRFFKGISRRLN